MSPPSPTATRLLPCALALGLYACGPSAPTSAGESAAQRAAKTGSSEAEASASRAKSSGTTKSADNEVSDADTDSRGTTAKSNVAHELRPLETARGRGAVHRFRIPLANAKLAFVDLGYKTALINTLGSYDIVVNGGYWAYQGSARKIQGLLVVDGKTHAPHANNLSGGILEIRAGRARLVPSDTPIKARGVTLAIQCNPRLVVAGQVIPKLEHERRAARTALCIRDQGHTLDAYLTAEDSRPTLQELAEFLVTESCEAALNLDGGPSTAAVARHEPKPISIGLGEALPYGLAFTVGG